MKKPDKTNLPLWAAFIISTCDTLLTYTALSKMALVNINEGLKEEYSMNKTFSAEYDFSCVRQIACAERFTRVRAIYT